MRQSVHAALISLFGTGAAFAGQVSVTPPTGIVVVVPAVPPPVVTPAAPAPVLPAVPAVAPPVTTPTAVIPPAPTPQIVAPPVAVPPGVTPQIAAPVIAPQAPGQQTGTGLGNAPAAVVQGFNVGSLSQAQMQQAIQLIDGLLNGPQGGLTPELRATLQSQRNAILGSLQGQ